MPRRKCGFDSRWALSGGGGAGRETARCAGRRRSGAGSAWGNEHRGVWESLGFRQLRELEHVSSNLTAPTVLRWGLCWYRQTPVKRPFAGSIPATAARSTRRRKDKPMGDGSRLESGRAIHALGVRLSLLPPGWHAGTRSPASCLRRQAPARRLPHLASVTSVGVARGSANGRLPGFEPGDGRSNRPPRTLWVVRRLKKELLRGSCCR